MCNEEKEPEALCNHCSFPLGEEDLFENHNECDELVDEIEGLDLEDQLDALLDAAL